MRIEGSIEVGEAAAYAARACAPVRGGSYPFLSAVLLALAIFGGGNLLLVVVDLLLGLPEAVAELAPYGTGLAALVAGWNLYRRMVLDRARKAYQTRGLVSPFPCAFEVTDGGLVIDTGRATMTAAWPAVSDLFVAGHTGSS